MIEELHLPWDRESLKELLKSIISTGETTKVDFKRLFDLSDIQHQADFLKDISAIANSYYQYYRNFGFIIFGAEQNKIIHTLFPDNEDHIQATIDDLVKKYIDPFIVSHFFILENEGNQFGALVIPPTRNAPHIIVNDIQKRYRGDIYVRNGTITGKAQPSNFSRFFGQHLDEYTYDLKQNIMDLQRQVSALERKLKDVPTNVIHYDKEAINGSKVAIIEEEKNSNESLSDKISSTFAKAEDIIIQGLFNEARKVNSFLESNEIPWGISTVDKNQSEEIFTNIESICSELWLAITNLVYKDDKGIYDDALVSTISYLAKQYRPQTGIPYNDWGNNIRYYPLVILLYLITIIGVAKKRDKLLRRIFKIELQERFYANELLPITYILFLIRRSDGVFHPMYSDYPQRKWCDPISAYTKLLIERFLNPDDLIWNKEEKFFIGEFVLCLAPMDVLEEKTKKPMIGHPSSGNFIYFESSIPTITRFLSKEIEWLKTVFERPLEEILSEFDRTAKDMGRSSGCWSEGFKSGAFDAAFPKNKE